MNYPPLAQEVIRNICLHMQDPALFAMAMTCQDFLEPALDTLWCELSSWKPLISCLSSAKELWTIRQRQPSERNRGTIKVLYPRRVITLEDLSRYLTHYAPRIRSIRLGYNTTALSIEAWQALHLATDGKYGVLSPLLTEFAWPSPKTIIAIMGEEAARQISPYISLFLGDSITTLSFGIPPPLPRHTGSLEEAVERYPRLRCLIIGSSSDEGGLGGAFPERCITSNRLEYLEELTLPFVTTSMVRHLALLPHLKALNIRGQQKGFITPSQTVGSDLIHGSFPSLNSLFIHWTTASEFRNLLHYIPPTNVISKVRCFTGEPASLFEYQEAIDTISSHCNPLTLETLVFEHMDVNYGFSRADEPLELDITQELNISSLFHFRNLQILTLGLDVNIHVTSVEIAAIPAAFPKIKVLDLWADVPKLTFHPPRIDHTHFVAILQGCPALVKLALVFDTSRMSGAIVPGAPFPLKFLEVGKSPIYSPATVISFLKANIPDLYMVRGCLHPQSITARRWEEVCRRWR
ncbi:hypothetical protein DFP72DRAFT_880715 [Ephemerocybe angulata]|uniref:F-box domain-containing protein n=1 Tax=Ephemerocybe angulata TaxID=980116 RepID=A0A8H6MAN8_9AGAR|nr:hypothetical protein DFP72DRAFT_880715 [Tulosesus angulatus]